MPDENGYAFIGRVRALSAEEGGSVPAAAMTAHGSRKDRDRALAAGFQRHLTKPFQPADLIALVADLAGRRAAPVVTAGSRLENQLHPELELARVVGAGDGAERR